MAVMRVKDSRFGAPAGIYNARFLGTAPMTGPPRMGRDGRPMEPGIEWKFVVVGGEQADQEVGRITGAIPTPRNAAGILLSGLMGRPVAPNEDVDPDQWAGKTFQVVIGPSKEDPAKTYVIQVARIPGQDYAVVAAPTLPPVPIKPPPPPAPPAPPKPSAPPAPRPSSQPALPLNPMEWWWVQTGSNGTPTERTRAEVQTMVDVAGSEEKLDEILVMPHDQSKDWGTAESCGFKPAIPF